MGISLAEATRSRGRSAEDIVGGVVSEVFEDDKWKPLMGVRNCCRMEETEFELDLNVDWSLLLKDE